MELTNKQIDYIDSFINNKEINSDNIDEIHFEVYDSMLDNYIINLDQYSDDEVEDICEIYDNLVWNYIESKI
jgi:hypothetical protein